MKFLSFLAALFVMTTVSAQSLPPDAPYKHDPKLPAFRLLQTDSLTTLTRDQLPRKYDYTVIMYFAPECGHCQYTTAELIKKMDSLKHVLFVFVAYRPMTEIREFYQHYNLAVYPNVLMGRDTEYIFAPFFHIESTPTIAVYDKKWMLVKLFNPPYVPVMEAEQLVELVNKK